ncbi:MAG: hypothetical protein U0N08_02505 [Oscillospiraceae bacterium]|nr:hypothetical protein [Oscillospiraceae bacterium]MCI6854843.1 hypothetical protein [Bacillota bacterium]
MSEHSFYFIRFMFVTALGRCWFYYLLYAALGVLLRLVIGNKRDFWILLAVSTIGWFVCEVIVDWGAAVEGVPLFDFAFTAGEFLFWFAVGFLLCSLVCRLAHRKKLS